MKEEHQKNCLAIASACTAAAIFITSSMIALWTFLPSYLVSISSHDTVISPDSALAVLVAATAVLAALNWPGRGWSRTWLALAGCVMTTKGSANLYEVMIGKRLWFNHLYSDYVLPHATLNRFRVPPGSAFGGIVYVLFAFAMLNWPKRYNLSQIAIFTVFLLSGIAVTGHAYDVPNYYQLPFDLPDSGLSIYGATSLMALSVALLLSRPGEGIVHLIFSGTPAGTVLKHFTLATIGALACFGIVSLVREKLAVESLRTQYMLSLLGILGLVTLVWSSIRALQKLERSRDKMQRKLEESRRLLQLVIESLPVGVWILDREGEVRSVNPAGQRIWADASIERLSSFGKFNAYWENNNRKLRLEDWVAYRALKKGETAIGELLQIELQGGERRALVNSAVPLRNEDGQISGAVLVNEDVTLRKAMEDQQRFLSSLSQRLAEAMEFNETLSRTTRLVVPELADCCFLFLLSGNGRLPRLAASRHRDPSLEKSTELASGFFLHSPYATMGLSRVLKTGHAVIVPSLNCQVAASQVESTEIREAVAELQLGSYIIAPLKARGEVRGAIALAMGSSGRKLRFCDRSLAEDLAQRVALALDNARLFSEAKEAVRVREDMLSIVSHDLKNPITSATLAVQLLLKQLGSRPEAIGLTRTATNIQRAVENMRTLVQNILDMGNIQSGTFFVELGNVELGGLFRNFEEMMQTIAHEKRIDLRFELENPSALLQCDLHRMQQVLSNVVGNALKFTPREGKIRVSARQENGCHLFVVEDSGPGIASDQLPFIFDRHWQAKAGAHKGNGLGLYIAKGIVEAHGGKIWAESEAGNGSRIFFRLPALAMAKSRVEKDPLSSPA